MTKIFRGQSGMTVLGLTLLATAPNPTRAELVECGGLKINVAAPWINVGIMDDPVHLLSKTSPAASVLIWSQDESAAPATTEEFANWAGVRAERFTKEDAKEAETTLTTVDLFGGKYPAVRTTSPMETSYHLFYLNHGQSTHLLVNIDAAGVMEIPVAVKTLLQTVTLPAPGKFGGGDQVGEAEPVLTQPSDPARHARMSGWAMLALRKFPEALTLADEAIKINPLDGGAWRTKGVALTELKDHAQAADALQKAIEIDRLDDRAWMALGNLMAREAAYDTAQTCYETVLKIKLNDPDALAALKALTRPRP